MIKQIQNGTLRLFAVCLFMLTLAGLAATQRSGQALAQITPESIPCPNCRTGMVGITRGQTARLNVVNLSDVQPGPCRTNDGEVQPDPCRQQVELMFFNGEGRVLVRSTKRLAPGHAAFLDLDGDTLERVGNRAEVRAVVLTPPGEAGRRRSFVVATVEVFDNETGRTAFVVATAPVDSSASDFSITVNPTSRSVAGGAATYQVLTTVTDGSSQPISFTVSGLPAGASASFNPASISSGGSSDLTVITTAGTPAGSYGLSITGTGTSATHIAFALLTVVQ